MEAFFVHSMAPYAPLFGSEIICREHLGVVYKPCPAQGLGRVKSFGAEPANGVIHADPCRGYKAVQRQDVEYTIGLEGPWERGVDIFDKTHRLLAAPNDEYDFRTLKQLLTGLRQLNDLTVGQFKELSRHFVPAPDLAVPFESWPRSRGFKMSESIGDVPTTCERVGEAMPDIAGIGILLGFSSQAFISLVLCIWVILLAKHGRLVAVKNLDEGTAEHEREVQRLEMVSDILMVGNDIQMVTGCALVITGFTKWSTIDLYHLHLIFDTLSFVGMSNCAALICWSYMASVYRHDSHDKKLRRSPRHRITYLYAAFFLALTILLEVRLSEWTVASDQLGKCYVTTGITSLGASHPIADKVYVAVTAAWLLIVMLGTVFGRPQHRKLLLILSAVQFPIHLYMMVMLRIANQESLEGEEDENGWDFGQTTAMILLAASLFELGQKLTEYCRFDHGLNQYPSQVDELGESSGKGVSLGSLVRQCGDRV
ncbi:hypothetical protein GQ53DRAFT_64810 [Thozetella sp. PMI_491]|nr:hypothetical protein GQ53DRAFT_64810 [Thozetella sp. PMI_491]